MNDYFQSVIRQATGASEIHRVGTIQELWGGYGEIIRFRLTGSRMKSVVVKHVRFPDQQNHPRGWNTPLSHQRKLRSYEVEVAWYRNWAKQCGRDCRIPDCLAMESAGHEVLIVMEDLDASGFASRKQEVDWSEIETCLQWLANFHATFMGHQPNGLWTVGTYWHLDTRPDELEALDDHTLKQAAGAIDQMLTSSPFQTLVHGDAKLANFCFSDDGRKVAAVDFQYVGGGCGMKDVAYFIGSCMSEEDCQSLEDTILQYYFDALRTALKERNSAIRFPDLENNWRQLYPVAWTDFYRFLKGWSPGHWKINDYSERLAREVISNLALK